MNSGILRLRFLVLSFVILICACFPAGAKTKGGSGMSALWKQVELYERSARPESAIETLKKIELEAKASGNGAESFSAALRRLVLDASRREDPLSHRIKALELMLPSVEASVRSIGTAVLATWYWNYYQENRWEFSSRSPLNTKEEDFTTWDLGSLVSQVSTLYEKALQDEEILAQQGVEGWRNVLTGTDSSHAWLRKSMADVVAWQVLQFYSSMEKAAADRSDDFIPDSDSVVCASFDLFLKANLNQLGDDKWRVSAIKLYQKLLRRHAHDSDVSALIDVELKRLEFVFGLMVAENKSDLLMERLEEIEKKWPQAPGIGNAMMLRAQILLEQKKYRDAIVLVDRVLKEFSATDAAEDAKRLAATIRGKELSVDGERVWAPEREGLIRVSYRNLSRIYLRVVRDDWHPALQRRWGSLESVDQERLAKVLVAKPFREWSVALDPGADYLSKTIDLKVAGLPPGFYRLMIADHEDFRQKNGAIRILSFWSSRIGMVTRRGGSAEGNSVVVADFATGKGEEAAKVTAFNRDSTGKFVEGTSARAGVHGLLSLPFDRTGCPTCAPSDLVLHAQAGDSQITTGEPVYFYSQNVQDGSGSFAFLFTDRAIYRPGQTVAFKIIAYKKDGTKRELNYTALANNTTKVEFFDANNKKVAEQRVKTNRFGSASGTFVIPAGGLTGAMSLRAPDLHSASVSFHVEEYKRPKFYVELSEPVKPLVLGETIAVMGRAHGFSGSPLDDAIVKYRVVRSAHLPVWGQFRYGDCCFGQNLEVEVAAGKEKSKPDGSFALHFSLTPDRRILEKADPWFVYRVEAEVLDATGEAHKSEMLLHAGYKSSVLEIAGTEWQTVGAPEPFTIFSKSLSGKPQLVSSIQINIHAIKQPEQVEREMLWQEESLTWTRWSEGEIVWKSAQIVREEANSVVRPELPPGAYRMIVRAKDEAQREIRAEKNFLVVAAKTNQFVLKTPNYFEPKQGSAAVGTRWKALWGTGYPDGQMLLEFVKNSKVFRTQRSPVGTTQHLIDLPVTEDLRGGFSVRYLFIRDYRVYARTFDVDVPWDNKDLLVKVESMRDKTLPGAHEKWKLSIKNRKGEPVAAEMLATIYDASLDALYSHSWSTFTGVWPKNLNWFLSSSTQRLAEANSFETTWNERTWKSGYRERVYPTFDPRYTGGNGGYGGMRSFALATTASAQESMGESMDNSADKSMEKSTDKLMSLSNSAISGNKERQNGSVPPANTVAVRRNLNETALFAPHLVANKHGQVSLEFTLPEALTTWRVMGIAHTPKLESGMLEAKLVTTKDLMIEPLAPRFLRSGDTFDFVARVSNQIDDPLSGESTLALVDAFTSKDVTAIFMQRSVQSFRVEARRSVVVRWKLTVPPDFTNPLQFVVKATSARHSDGEAGTIPLLSARVFVQESFPFFVSTKGDHHLHFAAFKEGVNSKQLQNVRLVIDYVSNPIWTMVRALPVLLENKEESVDAAFHRLFANALSKSLVTKYPQIEEIFSRWRKQPEAFKSPLVRNQDLLREVLDDTPWLQDSEREGEGFQRLGMLFEKGKIETELRSALHKLTELQQPSGFWPWYPGGPASRFMTLNVLTGMGRLRHFGVSLDDGIALKAAEALDRHMVEQLAELRHRNEEEKAAVDALTVQYLYGRSFFVTERPLLGVAKEAFDFWKRVALRDWAKQSLYSQAQLVTFFSRSGEMKTALEILESLRQRAIVDSKVGVHWKTAAAWWLWQESPLETHAMLLQAFSEVGNHKSIIDGVRKWLLIQKRTRAWTTDRATAEVLGAFLSVPGEGQLTAQESPDVSLGSQNVVPKIVEAGTGQFRNSIPSEQLTPALGDLLVRKTLDGQSYGSLMWQYFAPLSTLKSATSGELSVEKTWLVQKRDVKGMRYEVMGDGATLRVGDVVKARLVIRSDRDLEFVRLKDLRAAGFEPEEVLSGYRQQDGLWYYASTRDTRSEFFIDFLPKGTKVFEYVLRVRHVGVYQAGHAEIQCFYAPEFTARSDALSVKIEL